MKNEKKKTLFNFVGKFLFNKYNFINFKKITESYTISNYTY